MTVSIADLVPGASESGGDLSAATLREMFRFMLLARVLDERMWLLNRAGKAP
ncbi:MAG: thiamine pyrophosphate-dependent dehydrogenase E1 component subunit alpha, partial [Chloroflexia bacterium]|nr:thiamine pyrophosphate-dependent dehydrogenase E1 component subunit alpha [Chloroflexia bacterium]